MQCFIVDGGSSPAVSKILPVPLIFQKTSSPSLSSVSVWIRIRLIIILAGGIIGVFGEYIRGRLKTVSEKIKLGSSLDFLLLEVMINEI